MEGDESIAGSSLWQFGVGSHARKLLLEYFDELRELDSWSEPGQESKVGEISNDASGVFVVVSTLVHFVRLIDFRLGVNVFFDRILYFL